MPETKVKLKCSVSLRSSTWIRNHKFSATLLVAECKHQSQDLAKCWGGHASWVSFATRQSVACRTMFYIMRRTSGLVVWCKVAVTSSMKDELDFHDASVLVAIDLHGTFKSSKRRIVQGKYVFQ